MLVSAADSPQVAKVFKSLQGKMSIIKLVINILRRGLNAAAYTKREVLLIDIVSQLFPNNIKWVRLSQVGPDFAKVRIIP